MIKILKKTYAIIVLSCILPTIVAFVDYWARPNNVKPTLYLVNNPFWDLFLMVWLIIVILFISGFMIYVSVTWLKE